MKESIVKTKVRGQRVARFYKGKWQEGKRGYRFKNKLENPAAILRDIFIRNGFYKMKNFDKKESDKILGQLYLYSESKIEGFIL